MQESDDRNEGSIAEAQRMLLRLGTKRIRDPNPATSLRCVLHRHSLHTLNRFRERSVDRLIF
jgi:hypothetical protein